MAIDVACLASKPTQVTRECGGADGSALLAEAELKRNESLHRTYLRRASRALVPIAQMYKASVADTLAVCAMVLPSALGAANMLDLSTLRVGRIDNPNPNPEQMLLAAEANVQQFRDYWQTRKMTLDEGIALLGVHGLMEGKGCVIVANNSGAANTAATLTAAAATTDGVEPDAGSTATLDEVEASGALSPQHTYDKGTIATCNPLDDNEPFSKPAKPDTCPNVQMFRMNNQYYVDLLTPSISMVPFKLDVGLVNLTEATYVENYKDIACSFSSKQFRRVGMKEAADERSGDVSHWPDGGWLTHNTTGRAKDPAARTNCPHLSYWPYTRLDGFLAEASQKEQSALEKQVAASVRLYVNSNDKWQQNYALAYAKMMTVGKLLPRCLK
eukprot:gene3099-3378_t